MKKVRAFFKKIFCLNAPLTALISIPSYIFVGLTLNGVIGNTFALYFSCAASAYSLIISLTLMHRAVKKFCSDFYELPIIKKLMETPLGAKFFGSVSFRTRIFLYPGLVLNIAFCAVKLIFGIIYNSVWCIFLAFYYVFLAVMRFFLSKHLGRAQKYGANTADEYRLSRRCAIIMLLMDTALSCITTMIVTQNQGTQYPGYLIYAAALFAFSNITVSFISAVKSRKHRSPVISAVKIINLTAAMVSMLFLETAMLAAFSTQGGEFRRYTTSVSSAVICTAVLVIAIYMITNSAIQLKKPEISGGTDMQED